MWDQSPTCGNSCIKTNLGYEKIQLLPLLRSSDCGAGVRELARM
jgi:hypothetical protein